MTGKQISAEQVKVEHRGLPNTPPPVKPLRAQLEKWLAALDRAAIEELLKSEDWDSLPRFEWTHDGLTISFTASPRSDSARNDQNARPIGIRMGEAHLIETDKDIKHAVEVKAKKYGNLSLPLIVAVNVIGEHCDEFDINNALFGSETINVARTPDGQFSQSFSRAPNGAWVGRSGPRNRTVSAVLLGDNINIYFCGDNTPMLIHSPYASHTLNLPHYPLPESVPNNETHRMERKEGESPKQFLRLPEAWPPRNE